MCTSSKKLGGAYKKSPSLIYCLFVCMNACICLECSGGNLAPSLFFEFSLSFPLIFLIFTLLGVVTTISSQEKHLFPFSRQKFLMTFTFFYSVHYFRAHPTTLLLKILGGRMHGPSPHLKLWGDRPPVPPRFRPLLQCSLSCMYLCMRASNTQAMNA